jgi:hypothetical protein
MAAPAVIVRGLAVLEGVAGSFDAILYALQQTGKANQNFEEEIIKDVHGYDAAWIARNEHLLCDWALKLVGDTAAHAAVPATVVAYSAGTAGAAVSALGQPFLAPLSCVNFTAAGTTNPCFTGKYQVISGGDVDLGNTKVADLALKLRRYANTDQATASATVPA